MSDYMFMLESHLSANQNRVVSEVQNAADRANVNLFLTGGTMRDVLGGFPVRDLDFTVEGDALKLAKAVTKKTKAQILQIDKQRKSVHLLFADSVDSEIAMARQERYPRIGSRPQISAATIYEDLKGRDFTVNAMALSLNRASLGLLIDPNNGLADLERRELRASHNYVFYDDPARLLRLTHFRVRFGFAVEERTQQQYDNARLEELEKRIPPRRLFEELSQIAEDSNAGEVLRALEQEKLLTLFSPALAGAKLNLSGFAKLHKARQMISFGVELPVDDLALFLYLLTEKLTAKEKRAFIKSTAMRKSELERWQKLQVRTKKLEKELKSANLQKASRVYKTLFKVPGEEILFLYLHTPFRLVQDRIKNYLQKYLPAAQEITDRQVAAAGVEPGTPKFQKIKEDMIAARLNGRMKKPVPQPPPEESGPKVGRPPAFRSAGSRGPGRPRLPRLDAGRKIADARRQ
jgi:tRNA nucleotidyltransferase (CCA-adding enzyme)